MIGRFLCWLGKHKKPAGLSSAWCFIFVCTRCDQLCPGDLGPRRLKR